MALYDVVLKLFGRVTAEERALAAAYKRAVEPQGQLSILYDVGDSVSPASALGRVVARTLPPALPICRYSFSHVKQQFPLMQLRFDNLSRWYIPAYTRKFLFVARNFMVEPPLVLFWLGLLDGCSDKPAQGRRRHIWAIEADAAYVGNVRTFFDRLRADESDLLSTGYQIADHRWWAHHITTFRRRFRFHRQVPGLRDPLPEPLCGRAWAAPEADGTALPKEAGYYQISVRNDLKWAAGQCNSTKAGALFRLVPVERFSPRLLDHLAALLADGRFAASETFASSACAAERWCTLGDWASAGTPLDDERLGDSGPAGQPGSFERGVFGARGSRSAHYFYYPARFAYVSSWCEACDCTQAMQMRGRWVHPVGELKANLRNDHPAVYRRHRMQRTAQGQPCLAPFPSCERVC
jgi:hypothetical protein